MSAAAAGHCVRINTFACLQLPYKHVANLGERQLRRVLAGLLQDVLHVCEQRRRGQAFDTFKALVQSDRVQRLLAARSSDQPPPRKNQLLNVLSQPAINQLRSNLQQLAGTPLSQAMKTWQQIMLLRPYCNSATRASLVEDLGISDHLVRVTRKYVLRNGAFALELPGSRAGATRQLKTEDRLDKLATCAHLRHYCMLATCSQVCNA